MRQITIGSLAVADRENDRIPLIALHGLKILDEEAFLSVQGKEVREISTAFQCAIECCLHPVGMLNAHGDDAK